MGCLLNGYQSNFLVVLPILAVPKQRPRKGKHGFYTPNKTKNCEQEIKNLLKGFLQEFLPTPCTCAVGISIEFKSVRPKSSKRKHPTVKPDIDNLVKTVLDGMNGVVYEDDKQIIELHAKSVYADSQAIEIRIHLLP